MDNHNKHFLNRVFDIINDKDPDLMAEVIAQIEKENQNKENEATQKWLDEGVY